MKDNFAGRHLVLDVITKNKKLLNSIQYADEYMYRVTDICGMQLVIPTLSMKFPFSSELVGMVKKLEHEGTDSPIIREYKNYVGAKERDDVGVSSVGIWNTSHCCSHSWMENDYISIDLFSCLDYDINPILEFTKNYYNAKRIDVLNIERYMGAPQKIEQIIINN